MNSVGVQHRDLLQQVCILTDCGFNHRVQYTSGVLMNNVFSVIYVGSLVIKCTQMGTVDNAPASEKVQRTFGFRIHILYFPFSGYFFSLSASHQASGEVEDRPPTRLDAQANFPFQLSTFNSPLFFLLPLAFKRPNNPPSDQLTPKITFGTL